MFLVQFSSQGSQSLVLHIFLWAWKSNIPTHRQLALCTCMYHDYEESGQFMVCTRGDVWYSQTSNSLCFTSPKWQRPLKHVPTVTTASQQCPVNEQQYWWTAGVYKTSFFIEQGNESWSIPWVICHCFCLVSVLLNVRYIFWLCNIFTCYNEHWFLEHKNIESHNKTSVTSHSLPIMATSLQRSLCSVAKVAIDCGELQLSYKITKLTHTHTQKEIWSS